jgi:hypothetical protein
MSKSIVSEVKEKTLSVEPNVDRILRALSEKESFYFYKDVGQPIGEKADSLVDFAKKIEKIDASSLEFHYYRGDFEKWFRDTLGDPELVCLVSVKEPTSLKGEALRNFIKQQMRVRFNDLKMSL